MRLSERFGVVNLMKPADNQGGVVNDSFTMTDFNHAMIILSCGSLTGNAVLTVNSGATAAAKTTAETFNYRLADADQAATGADNYADWSTSASLTLTATTYDNKILIIEIDGPAMTDGQPWITVDLDSTASTHFSSAVAILSEARYASNDVPTAIS